MQGWKLQQSQQGCAGVQGHVKNTTGQSKANEISSPGPESLFRWFVSLSSKHRAGWGAEPEGKSPEPPFPHPVLGMQKTWFTPLHCSSWSLLSFFPCVVAAEECRWGRERRRRVPWRKPYGAYSLPAPWEDALCVARLSEEICTLNVHQ